jgi:hypothetical protein
MGIGQAVSENVTIKTVSENPKTGSIRMTNIQTGSVTRYGRK